MSLTSIVLNLMFKNGDALRDKGLTAPKSIKRHVNINYYGDTTEEHLYANHVFHLNIRNAEAIKLNDAQVEFFLQFCNQI